MLPATTGLLIECPNGMGMDSPGSHIKDELDFGVKAIKSNPKSYGAWYQRRWLLSSIKAMEPAFDVTPELLLCNRLLEMDARNCKVLSAIGRGD